MSFSLILLSWICFYSFNGRTWTVGAPTRWEGSREIDWFCSNNLSSLSAVRLAPWHLSDHKGLVVDFCTPRPDTKVGVLPRVADLRKPKAISVEAWRAALERAWEASTEVSALRAKLHDGSGCCVQELWDEFQGCLQGCFGTAFKECGVAAPFKKRLAAKGAVATVSWESQPCRGPRQEHGVMRHRKMRRRLARLYDYMSCLKKQADDTAGEQTLLNLQSLKQRCGDLSLAKARSQVSSLKDALRNEEQQEKNRRLSDWRHRVQSDVGELGNWLRSKATPATEGLIDQVFCLNLSRSLARYHKEMPGP